MSKKNPYSVVPAKAAQKEITRPKKGTNGYFTGPVEQRSTQPVRRKLTMPRVKPKPPKLDL